MKFPLSRYLSIIAILTPRAGLKQKASNKDRKKSTSSQERDDHSIAEDVKVAPVLMHNCEGHVLAQQIDQISPIFE